MMYESDLEPFDITADEVALSPEEVVKEYYRGESYIIPHKHVEGVFFVWYGTRFVDMWELDETGLKVKAYRDREGGDLTGCDCITEYCFTLEDWVKIIK